MDKEIIEMIKTNMKQSQLNMANYLRSNEAARILGVTPTTLRRWHHSGKLVAYVHPVTGYLLYQIHDLQKFFTALKRRMDNV